MVRGEVPDKVGCPKTNYREAKLTISFKPTEDLRNAAKITFENMKSYYEKHAVAWDLGKIIEVTAELENIDILLDEQVVGVLRLEFENAFCYLRDVQVSASNQNKGIGWAALEEAERLTKAEQLDTLKLRVFKISPAVALYERYGFVVDSEEERFLYMTKRLS